MNYLKLAIICGGPSEERGISLNSARSVLDHLKNTTIKLSVFYVDQEINYFEISPANLYSNTPSDFDFKLQQVALKLSEEQITEKLKANDLVFPVIHGEYGEDGTLQKLLENNDIKFIGSGSSSAKNMFNKDLANEFLRKHGFDTLNSIVCDPNTSLSEITKFFHENELQKVIVKPTAGGSSIGVTIADSPEAALKDVNNIYNKKYSNKAIIESLSLGREFTIVVLQVGGKPVALLPTEIEITKGNIFDYRKKYLPTNDKKTYTPARFSKEQIEYIRGKAVELFSKFNMRDFARLDGWAFENEKIVFSDFNTISGIEQNSFIFRQGANIGLSHTELLLKIIESACRRENLVKPEKINVEHEKKPVFVLFGNNNAERQVSLMSGTNVWLKLLQSEHFTPTPFLLENDNTIWELPYKYNIEHTVEEILLSCKNQSQCAYKDLVNNIRTEMNLTPIQLKTPTARTMEGFIKECHNHNAFVFLALHGGMGENGEIQKILEQNSIAFNGCDSTMSKVCMDKYKTGEVVNSLRIASLSSLPKHKIELTSTDINYLTIWDELLKSWNCEHLIVKPNSDGCSAGIVMLSSADELEKYCDLLKDNKNEIPKNYFQQQEQLIELPNNCNKILLEPFIRVDQLICANNRLLHKRNTGWFELTIGILETENEIKALSPSITIANGTVLSLEEKFQGGTGVNITPPPSNIISSKQVNTIKAKIAELANKMQLESYARIDFFFNNINNKIIIIEINSLPGLTPSTVIYHQALEETPSLEPKMFLEHIITNSWSKVLDTTE